MRNLRIHLIDIKISNVSIILLVRNFALLKEQTLNFVREKSLA